ncbi:hypothetical protein C1H46_034545 [Malus baccata]|uniref:Uncharacterized protein n=1 Tax=Malus baccata TaxID=106549 RepID=A0A540L0A8_MALBA|nr:hypothetical protein C1H46_034545 [Malus baccata]
MPPLQQMSFSQMPMPQLPIPGPYAFVSQTGSGSFNNFKGNNFKNKGKGKKFLFGGNQSQQQSLYGGQTSSIAISSRVSTNAKMPDL